MRQALGAAVAPRQSIAAGFVFVRANIGVMQERLPPYTVPKQDADLWKCGVVLADVQMWDAADAVCDTRGRVHQNATRILGYVRRCAGMSTAELSKAVVLRHTTVAGNLTWLLQLGLVNRRFELVRITVLEARWYPT